MGSVWVLYGHMFMSKLNGLIIMWPMWAMCGYYMVRCSWANYGLTILGPMWEMCGYCMGRCSWANYGLIMMGLMWENRMSGRSGAYSTALYYFHLFSFK